MIKTTYAVTFSATCEKTPAEIKASIRSQLGSVASWNIKDIEVKRMPKKRANA